MEGVSPTKPIRVLPMNMPKLLLDLIKGIIISSEDLHIVGEPVKRTGLLRAAVASKADVIILGDKNVSVDMCYHVLYRRPRLKIFAISADGRLGYLYELRPRAKTIGDLSAESLIAAIRGKTRPGDSAGPHR